MFCEWFAGCANKAYGPVAHPILGAVPTCKRCATRMQLEFIGEYVLEGVNES